MWTELKTFIKEAYTGHLNVTNITARQQGYVQNAYTVLAKESTDDEDDDVQTVITQMAALTTQSKMMATSTAATTLVVMSTINQLAANQQAMTVKLKHLQAARAPPAAIQFLTQFNIPPNSNFQRGGNRGGRHGGQGHGNRGVRQGLQGGGRNTRTPFANYITRQGGGGLPTITTQPVPGLPFAGTGPANASHSSIIKWYANIVNCSLG